MKNYDLTNEGRMAERESDEDHVADEQGNGAVPLDDQDFLEDVIDLLSEGEGESTCGEVEGVFLYLCFLTVSVAEQCCVKLMSFAALQNHSNNI